LTHAVRLRFANTLINSSKMSFRIARLIQPARVAVTARYMSTGDAGSGSGKGGGTGGAVRDAGGAFGKRQAAKEEQYFRNLNKSQLDQLKSSFEDEISYHKDEIEDHQEAIERHKRKLEELKKIADGNK